MNLQDFYTREQAAAVKRVSTRTIDRWIKSGRIKYQNLHRTILIPKATFDKFITPMGRPYGRH